MWNKTKPKPKILVLEDMLERIEQLQSWVKGLPVEIVWSKTVAEFRVALRKHPDAELILLDHDLGGNWGAVEGDANGEDGRDGAQAIPDSFAGGIVVWSLNPYGARAMQESLSARGLSAIRVPFSFDNAWRLRRITRAVAGAFD